MAPLPYGVAPPAHRLPDRTRLGPVTLQVGSIEHSVAFYRDVLGMAVLGEGGGSAALGVHGGAEPLVVLVAVPGTRPVPPHSRLGLYHVAYLLPDRAALGRFVAHLAATGARAGAADHGVSEALYLTDPDGLGIEVYADRPREGWTHHDRQLDMGSESLDLRALVAAAGDEPWTGMPAGTTVGHVHLHVGDLDEASRFYHEGLGLDRVVWGYPGALFLSAGGYHHHLGTNTWARGAVPPGPEDARLLAWTITLPTPADVDAAAAGLAALGYPVTRDDGAALVADPWGTPLRVVSEEQGG